MIHTDLIKRAWSITWRYKVLWIFGILLALASGGGGIGGGGNTSYRVNGTGVGLPPPMPGLERFNPGLWLGIATLCCCLLLIWIIVAIIVQYVARTALYRSVDQIEATSSAPTWREGFRLGWSNRAFRLWLLDLIIGIPFVIVAIVVLTLGATPLLLLLVDSGVVRALGIALTIGLELLLVLLLVIAVVILGVLKQFWSREIALADLGIGQAFAVGYARVRSRAKDVGIMWLLMTAIGLGFGLIMVPIAIAVVLLAIAVGGGLGYALYAATQSVGWAIAVGLPPFLLIVVVPLTLIEGIYLVFGSSAWTLTYREVAAATKSLSE
jgi:hypothetical protein